MFVHKNTTVGWLNHLWLKLAVDQCHWTSSSVILLFMPPQSDGRTHKPMKTKRFQTSFHEQLPFISQKSLQRPRLCFPVCVCVCEPQAHSEDTVDRREDETLQISTLVKVLRGSPQDEEQEDEDEMIFFSLWRAMTSRLSRNSRRPRNSHTYTETPPARLGDAAADPDDDPGTDVGGKCGKVPLSTAEVPVWSILGIPAAAKTWQEPHKCSKNKKQTDVRRI